jgi:ankyrin repeat protein
MTTSFHPKSLSDFAEFAIQRRPTIHDIIHYVAWMGYIDETKYYPSTCKEAANHIEFAYANSRATYGKTKSTRLHAVCANSWSSYDTKKQQEWARITEDHARWGTIHYEQNSWKRTWTPINVKQAKYDVEWRQTRVLNLMALVATYAKNNLPKIINQTNTKGYSALHAAVYSGNLELVKLLLDNGAYPEGHLPILWNSQLPVYFRGSVYFRNHPNILKIGPGIRAKEPAHRCANLLEPYLNNTSTMTVAIRGNHGAILTELVLHGHRIDVSDVENDDNPISYAIKRNSLSCVQALLKLGVSTKGLIHKVINIYCSDCTAMISLLCKYGADVNETNELGQTALMLAVVLPPNYKHVIKSLIQYGALINMRNDLGETALFTAVHHENTIMVKELLEYGADTNIRNNDGLLPKDITDNTEIEVLLARANLKRRFKHKK